MKKKSLFTVVWAIALGCIMAGWSLAQEIPVPTPPAPAASEPVKLPAPAAPVPTPPAPVASEPAKAPAAAAPAPAPATPVASEPVKAPTSAAPAPTPATPVASEPAPAPAPAVPAPAPATPVANEPAQTPAPEVPAPAPPAPVASEPAQTPAPEVKSFDPEKSYTKLAHPSVAARLGLSDAQRAEIQRLLVLRSQELAKAPQDQWPTVIAQNEQKLADVLTPAQKTLWPKVFEEKKIRFIFKMQRWADVLQWFADQAGLQLVMDAPPPGTLNYADQRDYTPSEAIDVLNSVLQTKGYTLVRNDRMLMLFDLKRGKIPVQFLPKLKPEDLPERGRFEYTTVIFPLERRNRVDVVQTLEPFKGPYCHIVPMPGNSLMITDTASTLMVLQKVIESVENPPVPTHGVGAPPPAPAVWKTYTVEKNDPGKVEEIFKEFAPTAKLLRVGNSKEIHVFLPEAEQEPIQNILTMLEADTGVQTGELILASYSIAPYLQGTPQQIWQLGRMRRSLAAAAVPPVAPMAVNPLNPYDPSISIGMEIIAILKKTFPAAVVSETPVASNVVVLASQTEQDKIKAFFESLKQVPASEDEPVAKLYRYADKTKKMNEETLKQLKSVVPMGVFSLDEEQGQILVVATAKEQELLAKAVTELEIAAAPEEDKIVVSYRMPVSVSTRFSAMLRQLVTKKELEGILELRDTKQGQVTVWATARQHALIQKILDEVSGTKAPAAPGAKKPAEPVLVVYPMERAYAYNAQQVLSNMIAGADFSYDFRTNAVIAVATPDIQEVVRKAVEELDKGVDDNIVFIGLKTELPPDILRQLARVAPKAVVVQNRRNLQVIATGPKSELEKVKAVLNAAEAASPTKEEIVVHTLQTAAPSTVMAVLADVFPEVKATVNAVNNQLVLQMSGDLKAPVTSLLTQLDGELEFVPIKKAPSEQLLASLRSVAPRATVIVDRENGQMMVQGTKPDVEKVRKIVAQAETAAPVAEEIYVHTFKQAYPYYVVSILREIYPEVKVAGYPTHNQLAVRLQPGMKEKVVELFNQVDGDIEIIGLKKELPAELIAVFPQVAPYAVVVPDKKNAQVMVYGPKPDVEKIKKLITASESAAPIEEEIFVYTFKQAYPYYAAAVIREIYPDVKIGSYPTHNQLTLRLRPELKEKIQKLLEEMDGDIVFVPLKKELTPELLAAFPRIAPYATVIQDKQNALAMIYGPKPDVEKIQKMISTSESALPIAEEVIVHTLKHVESPTVVAILREIHPDVKVTDDAENGRLVIRLRPDKKEAVASLLTQLDAADPDKEKRYFKSYPLDTGLYSIKTGYGRYTPVQFITDLQKLVPRAKLSFDENSQQLIVWGTENEHQAVDAAVKNMSDDGKSKKYGRFPLRRAYPYTIIPVVQRMFPTVIPTYDYYTGAIIVEGHPKLIDKVMELLETLDPSEPSPNDPVVRFYTLGTEPTPSMVQGLQRLVPTAMIVPEKDAKQIMVVAKPDEQKLIEGNVQVLVATFAAPEEPMLFIYPATQDQRDRLEAFVKTAAKDLKGVSIVADKSPNQVAVWARPSEHQLIATVIKQMQENRANEPPRQLKVFQMSIGDLVTAQEILKVSHPDATQFVDKQGNRLLVWATPEELEKVTKTLTVQGNLDNRQMVAYPIAGAKPETVQKVIQDVFNGLKITPEPQNRRLLVWASPEEHVKIAEIVEQANKEVDPTSELAEKFVAYSAVNLDAKMVTNLFKALIPDADVYADVAADKITVRARSREHVRIKELLEQLREKDDKLRPVLAVYPFGETDPVMIEAMLRSQLPNAESMSPDDIVERLGWSYYYERMPWFRYYNSQNAKKKNGYFKVDPQTQSVFVFVAGEDQQEVAKALDQIVAAGNQEGIKPVVKRYSLDEMSYYDIYTLLRQVAPSAIFESVYSYNPGASSGRQGFYASYRDFLAYTRESEHVKIETMVKELNDRAGVGKKEMLSLSLPEGSKYNRDKIIETIQKLYPDVNPMPGSAANQILVWAPKHKLEKVRQIVDEACKPLPDEKQTVVKSYPLQYISVENAKSWLAAVCPNASFDPTPGATPRRPVAPRGVPGEAKFVVVLATPLEHLEIEKAIKELDRDLPPAMKMLPRIYSLSEHPQTAFQPLRLSLIQAFPNAVCTQGAEQQSILVVATENDHRQVAEFLKAYKDDRESKRQTLEVYALKKLNYYKVLPLIQKIAPAPALVLPASKPEQISVWATPKEHADIAIALTRLETAANDVENQNLKIFKVGGKKAQLAAYIMSYQFPGTLTFATGPDELLSWGCPADHESMAAMLQTVAEAYPEPVLKTYYFKHVPLGEGFAALNRIYADRAAISVRPSTGDLLVNATPEIQEKIAQNIAEFDKPRPAETESLPIAYDLSDIPLAQLTYAAQSIRTALPGMIVLPSSVPGQLVVWGKLADQQKVKSMVDQMISERPETTSRMQAYMIHRGTAVGMTPMLRLIVPNAKYGYGTNPNQLLVWAKDSDQAKIKGAVDKLNEAPVDLVIEAYSLKNIYATGARTLVQNVVLTQGLDATVSYDYYGNRLVVQAKAEDQKTIKDLLDKLKTEDRELEVFVLETVDPITAYTAIQALFADESYYTTPGVEVDQNTNMIFVQGTRDQLDKTRRMLVNMGETHLQRQMPGDPPSAQTPSVQAPFAALPKAGSSQLRVLRVEGNMQDTIRELEKLWPQYQQNRLLINREDQPLIQKKEEPKKAEETPPSSHRFNDDLPVAFFSVDDPVKRDEKKADVPLQDTSDQRERVPSPSGSSISLDGRSANVYVTANEDGTLTVASYDTEALDRLESILKRISDRVVFEGRDYTIYSVRNISADLVALKIQLILRERLAGRQQRLPSGYQARYQAPRLEIVPDLTTNTIYVRGAKAERQEVANLIALLDVSELPGERSIRKPIKVPIKNTQAARIWQQVLNVYQQKIQSTRLPGGVYPRVTVDNVTNSLEIIAPEPLATELKEYAEDLDRRTVEEPARKVHVIPLEVRSQVIQRALQVIRQSSDSGYYYQYQYGQGGMMPYNPAVRGR